LYICSIVKGGFPLKEASHSFFSLYQGVELLLLSFYAILVVWCITFGIRAYDPRVFLLQMSHLGIFAIIFFGEVSDYEIFRILRRHMKYLW
jgi:hypothetical protein